jgi:methionyl-tRNA synthetase
MKGADESRRLSIVRTTLESVYVFMHFLAPILPLTAETVFQRLNTSPIESGKLQNDFYNLHPGTDVVLGDILFRKIE